MKKQKRLVLISVLVLMAGTAGALLYLKSNKHLGAPGVKSTPIPGSIMMTIELPEHVLDYTSSNCPEDDVTKSYLPNDTSFASRLYEAPDGFAAKATIILMGTDRTSIHKADYCLAGSGYTIDGKATAQIAIGGPQAYPLDVAKWTVSRVVEKSGGERVLDHGLYVFWFVADTSSTPSYFQYKCTLMWDVLRTGVLGRWAYVSYYAVCQPGEEDAAFERMSKLIAASVPEFQLPPRSIRLTAQA